MPGYILDSLPLSKRKAYLSLAELHVHEAPPLLPPPPPPSPPHPPPPPKCDAWCADFGEGYQWHCPFTNCVGCSFCQDFQYPSPPPPAPSPLPGPPPPRPSPRPLPPSPSPPPMPHPPLDAATEASRLGALSSAVWSGAYPAANIIDDDPTTISVSTCKWPCDLSDAQKTWLSVQVPADSKIGHVRERCANAPPDPAGC